MQPHWHVACAGAAKPQTNRARAAAASGNDGCVPVMVTSNAESQPLVSEVCSLRLSNGSAVFASSRCAPGIGHAGRSAPNWRDISRKRRPLFPLALVAEGEGHIG